MEAGWFTLLKIVGLLVTAIGVVPLVFLISSASSRGEPDRDIGDP